MPKRPSQYEFKKIALEELEVSSSNVRNVDVTQDIDELAYSLKAFGQQQPIVVQRKDGRYEIIIGQRRYLAAKKLRWPAIDARVNAIRLSEFEAKVVSFSENVQRVDLAPRDKADTCAYLLDVLGTVSKVASHLGITEQTVRKWLDYAGVPEELKRMVEDKRISRPMATRLALAVPDESKAVAIAQRISELKPAKQERDRIIQAAEDLPNRSWEAILTRAKSMQSQRKITFVLPDAYAASIDRAAKRLATTPADIARDATVDWLKHNRF